MYIAVAIANAELYAGERDQRQLSDALRSVGLALSETLDFDELLDRYHRESVTSPSGVEHLLFWRR